MTLTITLSKRNWCVDGSATLCLKSPTGCTPEISSPKPSFGLRICECAFGVLDAGCCDLRTSWDLKELASAGWLCGPFFGRLWLIYFTFTKHSWHASQSFGVEQIVHGIYLTEIFLCACVEVEPISFGQQSINSCYLVRLCKVFCFHVAHHGARVSLKVGI